MSNAAADMTTEEFLAAEAILVGDRTFGRFLVASEYCANLRDDEGNRITVDPGEYGTWIETVVEGERSGFGGLALLYRRTFA